jgi:hypothetical protein
MAAILTSTGITFGDSTSLSSRYGITPQSSVATFYQAAAPTGWTQNTTQNNKALRIVSGSGGGSGGSVDFTTAFPNSPKPYSASATITGTTGNTTLTVAQLPVHNHPNGFGAAGRHGWNPGGEGSTATGNNGSNAVHAHPWGPGSASISGSFDFRCQYIDVIMCSLN